MCGVPSGSGRTPHTDLKQHGGKAGNGCRHAGGTVIVDYEIGLPGRAVAA